MQNKQTHARLVVSVPDQQIIVFCDDSPPQTYPVSTSRFGLGTEPGSFRTPLGNFRICKKFGDDAPLRLVFRSRQATGEIAPEGGEEDLILTRILWLEGTDEENQNTKERYIYIHGTNQENRIGSPTSHGCVRMRNNDIAELFAIVPTGSPVQIVNAPTKNFLTSQTSSPQ